MSMPIYAVHVRKGLYQAIRVTYDIRGRSTVEAIGPWESAADALARKEGYSGTDRAEKRRLALNALELLRQNIA